MIINFSKKAKISLLLVHKIIFLIRYSNYQDVFFKELVQILLKNNGTYKIAMKVKKSKQHLYKLI